MARSWLIGSDPTCDLVVDHEVVSARHCRLTDLGEAGFLWLEDNGSTNGTYVDGERITAPTRVSRGDRVTLGRSQPMPWPVDAHTPDLASSMILRIGREADNDLVVSLPTVSGYHARVVWSGRPGEAEIEDLGSSNGTAVGSPDRRASRAVVRAGDTIYLGSYPLPAARVFEALGQRRPGGGHGNEAGLEFSQPPPLAEVESIGAAVAEECRAAWRPVWKPVLFLALGGLAGVLAVVSAGFDARALRNQAEWAGAAQALAALLSRMGLAAVGLGLVIGVGMSTPPVNLSKWLTRAVLAVLIGLAASVLEWGMCSVLAGAAVGGRQVLGLLALGSGTGLMLGLALAAVAPRPGFAWGAVAVLALPLWALGGESTAWNRLPDWAKGVAGISPARWTFEGLLLAATERVPTPAPGSGEETTPVDDLAEPYFPVETDRTGPFAVRLALGAMLLGWGVLAVFIAAERRSPALAPSRPLTSEPAGPRVP